MYKNIHVYKNTYMHNILIQIKKKTCLPYGPAIPSLTIYPREMKIYVHTNTCTK
jgi:hypothetical protein